MDSVNSDSPTRQLHGARLMHKLLQAEPSRTRLVSKLNASVGMMARIMRMLDRTGPGEDTDIRLFAAKVVAELARSLRVVTVPGTMQLVSALLDTDGKPKRGCAILDDDTDDEQEGKQAVTVTGAIDFQDAITGAHNDNGKQRRDRIGIDWFSQQVVVRSSSLSGAGNGFLDFGPHQVPVTSHRWTTIEMRKLAAETLRNLAVDGSTSLEIGRVKVVVTRLVDAFLSQEDEPSGTSNLSNQSLQKVAGQVLAVLTMESADNCVAVLREPRDLIAELTDTIARNKHRYVAARLLRNLFLHVRVQFGNSQLSKLGETLGKVLATVMDPKAVKAELEVTIGLCSQLCRVIPEDDFTRELERTNGGHGKEAFVKKLVDALRENVNPGVDCSGIRRVVIEQAIHLMKCRNSQYVALFDRRGMKEALLTVEQTPWRVERFVVFMGSAGFMEHREPIADLVAN